MHIVVLEIQRDRLIIHSDDVLQQIATHLAGEAAQSQTLLRRGLVVDDQDRLDRIDVVENVTERAAGFHRADYRQAIQRNSLPGALVDLPPEDGELAYY